MKNTTMILINKNEMFPGVENFCQNNRKEIKAALLKAYASHAEDAACALNYITRYPDNKEYWEAQYKKHNNVKFIVMPEDNYLPFIKSRVMRAEIEEITEERYYEMLNVLPPMYYKSFGGGEEFCMSERYMLTFTAQYAKYHGKYYKALVDLTDRKTWLHNRLQEA